MRKEIEYLVEKNRLLTQRVQAQKKELQKQQALQATLKTMLLDSLVEKRAGDEVSITASISVLD